MIEPRLFTRFSSCASLKTSEERFAPQNLLGFFVSFVDGPGQPLHVQSTNRKRNGEAWFRFNAYQTLVRTASLISLIRA